MSVIYPEELAAKTAIVPKFKTLGTSAGDKFNAKAITIIFLMFFLFTFVSPNLDY